LLSDFLEVIQDQDKGGEEVDQEEDTKDITSEEAMVQRA
jgi:hypothetical protein